MNFQQKQKQLICLFQKYTILETLGEGAEAIVYKAKNQFGQIQAVKVYKGSILPRELAVLKNIQNESESLQNFVKIFNIDEQNQTMSMECASMSLEQLIKQEQYQKRDLFYKNKLLIQIAEGIQQLHNLKYMHRDLKPENILIFEQEGKDNYILKISDTGSIRDQGQMDISKTIGVGTGKYTCPEVKTGIYDETIDIYALGKIWYELITFQPLIKNQKELKNLTTQKVKSQVKQEAKNLSDELQQLMIGMLSEEVINRPKISQIIERLKEQISQPENQINENTSFKPFQQFQQFPQTRFGTIGLTGNSFIKKFDNLFQQNQQSKGEIPNNQFNNTQQPFRFTTQINPFPGQNFQLTTQSNTNNFNKSTSEINLNNNITSQQQTSNISTFKSPTFNRIGTFTPQQDFKPCILPQNITQTPQPKNIQLDNLINLIITRQKTTIEKMFANYSNYETEKQLLIKALTEEFQSSEIKQQIEEILKK